MIYIDGNNGKISNPGLFPPDVEESRTVWCWNRSGMVQWKAYQCPGPVEIVYFFLSSLLLSKFNIDLPSSDLELNLSRALLK